MADVWLAHVSALPVSSGSPAKKHLARTIAGGTALAAMVNALAHQGGLGRIATASWMPRPCAIHHAQMKGAVSMASVSVRQVTGALTAPSQWG